MTKSAKIGVLLANLGTPDSPTPKSISRYLWQFLTDPRVVDLPRCKWYPLLKAIILPLRSKRIAKNYQAIWTEQGSPLLAISRQQKDALQAYLDKQNIDTQVEIAMTYGNPSMQSAVKNLLKNQVERIIVLPLYPQYSSSTTGAVFDAFANALKEERGLVPFDFIHSYHVDENYIDALANSIKVRLKSGEIFNGVANMGKRPTINGLMQLLEVHLFDFSQNIYGQMVEVEFCHKIRNEIKFPSFDDLKVQIEKDVETAKAFFNS